MWYVLIRMNVGLYNNPLVANKDLWFQDRFERLSRSTLPSVPSDKIVILAVDHSTPKEHLDQISTLNVEVVLANKSVGVIHHGDIFKCSIGNVKAKIIELNGKKKTVITTRIDNDDYFLPNYFTDIKQRKKGIQQHTTQIRYKEVDKTESIDNGSFFPTVVSNTTEMLTVWDTKIFHFKSDFPKHKIEGSGAVYVVHGNNYTNLVSADRKKPQGPSKCKDCEYYNKCGVFCRLLTRKTDLNEYLKENRCPNEPIVKEATKTVIKPSIKYNKIFKRGNGRVLDVVNIFKGQSAFLCCNGPSFGEVDKEKLRRSGILTMGVNNGPCRPEFRPDLWTAQDPPNKFLRSIWADPKIMKFTLFDYRNKKLYDKEAKRLTDVKIKDCPNVVFHRRHSNFKADTWFDEQMVCWGVPQKTGGNRSTMLAAIHILWFLGIKRIYLLGVDFHMNTETKYFFDEERKGSSIRGNNRLFKNMSKYFTQLLPYMKANNLEIFNCNKDSQLGVFPFMKLSDAIAENEIILNEETRGMYASK